MHPAQWQRVRQAAGVREQVPHGDRRPVGLPGQETRDRRIDPDQPLLGQLHDGRRGEGLAHRIGELRRVGPHRATAGNRGEPDRLGMHQAPAVDGDVLQARRPASADKVIEQRSDLARRCRWRDGVPLCLLRPGARRVTGLALWPRRGRRAQVLHRRRRSGASLYIVVFRASLCPRCTDRVPMIQAHPPSTRRVPCPCASTISPPTSPPRRPRARSASTSGSATNGPSCSPTPRTSRRCARPNWAIWPRSSPSSPAAVPS
mmetsp:Transcript_5306/g.9368  ORF Transcript_5306/g.9368 Transcript_5306/m.9368 type:complete len:260 (-) Transcript_5306:1383-2162(-)